MKPEADIIDLQSWIPDAFPQLWEVTKYLSAPHAIWNAAWISAGCPDISEPAA